MPSDPDLSSTDVETRSSPGLDALRDAAARHDDWAEPWRALLQARLRGPLGVWVLALVAAVALGIGVFALAHHGATVGSPGSTDLPMADASASRSSDTGADAGSGDQPAAELVVQVAGAVNRPGVFHLPAGSRVGDLVQRAGGLASDADADRVDLAASLADGVLVYIPRRGQPAPPGPVVGGDASGAETGPGATAPLDLNTATAAQLDALPGVGPTIAAAIVAYRQQHGPFARVDDLADVSGIGPAKLAQIRPHVHV